MRRIVNKEHVEGRLFQHDLEVKTVQNQTSANYGKEFISGNVEVAVDEEGLNVIPVHFTYVTEMTNSGKKSPTYTALKRIIDEDKSIVSVGKDEAFKVRIDTALALNDFYANDDQLVSVKTNEGGFISIVNGLCDEKERNTWEADMVITGCNIVEADPDKNIDTDYMQVKGAIFNFRNELLPIEFILRNKDGFKHFEDMGASPAEPTFTKVWGRINCLTKTTTVEEESAFGEAAVKTYERKVKEWEITGTQKVIPYDFGGDDLTVDELTKAMQDREIKLADTKKRSDEYKAQKAAGNTTSAKATNVGPQPAKTGTFTF
jgi:hypothetical protein